MIVVLRIIMRIKIIYATENKERFVHLCTFMYVIKFENFHSGHV
jgi:hypothetical protein